TAEMLVFSILKLLFAQPLFSVKMANINILTCQIGFTNLKIKCYNILNITKRSLSLYGMD
ncbi:hypothetical protein DIY18_06265, partial [Streptococcus iniae]|uniref:hypothetical protein n=1 Tax=Streptococcus iniae TaxID=1346 RepID=UPI000F2CFCCF